MDLKERYSSKEKKEIEKRLLSSISFSTDKKITKILKNQIFPSKRIRSYILHLLCKDVLSDSEFYKIATSIELFQQSTLIFDDVIDDTPIRDGNRITLQNNLWSSGKADHLAAILMLLSEKELIELGNINYINEFNRIKLEMFNSQLIDIFLVGKPKNISYIDWLLNSSYKKTSSFMSFPFFVHAKNVNSSQKEIENHKRVGESIWILYQIGDDLFDVEDGIKTWTLALTYPLAYILDNLYLLNQKEKKIIEKLLEIKHLDESDSKLLTGLFRKYKDEINNSSNKYFDKYLKVIQKSQISDEIKSKIIDLLKKVINPLYWQYKKI